MGILEKIAGIVLYDEPMRNHTTLQIGGSADIFVVPKDVADISYCITYAKEKKLPLHVFGNGSKILVSDKGIRGLVIKLSKTIDYVKVHNSAILAGAGCSLAKLISIATERHLSGLEFAAGIPGTLGGAIAMNAGTFLGSIGKIVTRVNAIDMQTGALFTLSDKECEFGYRQSIFQRSPLIVLSAELTLLPGNDIDIKRNISDLLRQRQKAQPLEQPNAGSIFKNPEGNFAAKLIDSAGLKGLRVGGAQISDKHANFIINIGNATAEDVCTLIRTVQKEVKNRYDIFLATELRIIDEQV